MQLVLINLGVALVSVIISFGVRALVAVITLFEDAPFFATEPDRVSKTFVGIDTFANVPGFLSQSEETDWLKWYMPHSYWARLFGPVWPVFTKAVLKQRNRNPGQPPIVRWLPININRIWETQCHPFDLKFAQTFAENTWFIGFDQAPTLSAIKCPTVFLKATTRFDKQGNLLAALSDDDLKRIESLLPNNHTIKVKSSHDIHFAHTKTYQKAINFLRVQTAAKVPGSPAAPPDGSGVVGIIGDGIIGQEGEFRAFNGHDALGHGHFLDGGG